MTVGKRIRDGIEEALKIGIKGWDSKDKAAIFFGVSPHTLTSERIELLESKGLYVTTGASNAKRKEANDKKILDGIERALKLGIGGWGSRESAAKFFDVSTKVLTKERVELLKSRGIHVAESSSNAKRKEANDKKILDGIERALKLGIGGWGSRESAAKFFDVSARTLTEERVKMIESRGLVLSIGLSTAERKENSNEKILDGIERARRLGVAGWDSRDEAAKFFGVNPKVLTEERVKMIESRGLVLSVGLSTTEKKETYDEKILNGIERALKIGIKGWDSRESAAKFFDLSRRVLVEERIKMIESRGLVLSVGPSHAERKEKSNEKILDGIERALKLGIKGWGSRKAAAKFFGVSPKVLTRDRIALIRSQGIEIKEKAEISPNTLFVIQNSEELGIRIDSAQALMELSLDFFAKEVRINNDALPALESFAGAINRFSELEARELIGSSAWGLIGNSVDDFSIMELKLELFKNQVYFTAEKTEAVLKELELDTSELHTHAIRKRFRLAKKAVEYGLAEINYVDTLPAINNCENRNIFIHSSIRKKSSFMKLWKEYAEIMMCEDIGGSVSRSPLPENLRIEEEIQKNSSRAKAYLVDKDSIGHLKGLGYEGIAALFLYGSREAKNSMPRALQSLAARLTGFFLFLSQKGLAVPHSRFLMYTGGEVVSGIAEYFTRNHVVTKALSGFISSSGSKSFEKFPLLSYKLAIAVRNDASLENLSFNEINAYVSGVEGENVSGTLRLDSFCLKFLQHLGNTNALKKKADFDINIRWAEELLNSEVSQDVLKWYDVLIEELIEAIEYRYEDEKISEQHTITHIKAIVFLFEFLSTFEHKLNREEMVEVLNPIIKSKTKQSFSIWARERNQENAYLRYQSIYVVLFENIKDTTYLGLYLKTWIRRKDDSSERALVRDGLELPVLVTFQDAVLMDSFPDERYPFLRSTPKGEMIDMSSWWNYDFSPVPAICAWLTSKLPRRGKHIRFLDVNKFLVFNPDGTLKGLFFNTDKNKKADAQKDMFIPKSLLVYAFSDAEIQLLISYTKYIQQAYSDREPVKYSSRVYAEIMPLFPHHNQHDVLSKEVLAGYMAKLMIKTQIIVRHNAKNGIYDPYYSPSALELKREYLSTIDLVTPKSKYNVPESIEGLNSLTVNQCLNRYRMEQGVHNFRHAISTALAHMGLSIFRVRVFTGHANINTLGDVYMHSEGDAISLIRTTTSKFFDDIRRPANAGNKFIEKICMPLVKSKDPSAIFDALKEHGFMSLPRKAQKGPDGASIDSGEEGVVSNGVEIASLFNPATWVSKSFGICPVGEGCPEESRGVCSLCPFLIFNASFVKGILLELNDAMNELAVFNAKNVESIRSISGDEMQKQVAQKISEVTGWSDMFSRVEAQLLGEDVDLADGRGKSLAGARAISKNLFGFRRVSIDESNMEVLYEAMELDLNEVRFDRKAKEVAWKISMQCARNKDFTTLEQLEKDGLNQFIAKYGRMNFDEKKAFVLEMLGDRQLASSSPLVQQKNAPLLEIIE